MQPSSFFHCKLQGCRERTVGCERFIYLGLVINHCQHKKSRKQHWEKAYFLHLKAIERIINVDEVNWGTIPLSTSYESLIKCYRWTCLLIEVIGSLNFMMLFPANVYMDTHFIIYSLYTVAFLVQANELCTSTRFSQQLNRHIALQSQLKLCWSCIASASA